MIGTRVCLSQPSRPLPAVAAPPRVSLGDRRVRPRPSAAPLSARHTPRSIARSLYSASTRTQSKSRPYRRVAGRARPVCVCVCVPETRPARRHRRVSSSTLHSSAHLQHTPHASTVTPRSSWRRRGGCCRPVRGPESSPRGRPRHWRFTHSATHSLTHSGGVDRKQSDS